MNRDQTPCFPNDWNDQQQELKTVVFHLDGCVMDKLVPVDCSGDFQRPSSKGSL